MQSTRLIAFDQHVATTVARCSCRVSGRRHCIRCRRIVRRWHRGYARLEARGKREQHSVTAVARELTGFVWAALTQ
jgi:hypothetical protein